MFDLSLGEIAIIALLILVCFDVDQLPGLMRQAGRMYAKVRGASDDLRRAFNSEVARAEADQRREDMERRRDDVVKLRNARAPAPSRPPPADAVMRPTRAEQVAAEQVSAGQVAAEQPPTGQTPAEQLPVAPAQDPAPAPPDDASRSGGEP